MPDQQSRGAHPLIELARQSSLAAVAEDIRRCLHRSIVVRTGLAPLPAPQTTQKSHRLPSTLSPRCPLVSDKCCHPPFPDRSARKRESLECRPLRFSPAPIRQILLPQSVRPSSPH